MIPIILDTETTGFVPPAKVVQIAAVAICPDGDDSMFEALCNPGIEHLHTDSAIGALEFNGISAGKIAMAHTDDEVAYEFKEWLRYLTAKYNQEYIIYAYNYRFDQRFLAEKPWSIEEDDWAEDDLMEWARQLMCNSERGYARPNKPPKLVEAEYSLEMDIPGNPHDAMHDALAAAVVYKMFTSII